MGEKILIVNFGAFGDIINSTPIANHYKKTDPNNEIVWVTRKKYHSVLTNNPNIDSLLFINEDNLKKYDNVSMTYKTKAFIKRTYSDHRIIFPAPYMSETYDGTPKSTLLDIIKDESSKISDWKCDFIPNVFLSAEEQAEANNFFKQVDTNNKSILLEYESFSNQTPFDFNYITNLCKIIEGCGYNVIFSGLKKPNYYDKLKNSFDIQFYHYSGSFISNAQLYNLVDIFIGCCSGLTCLTSSDFCDIDKTRIEVCRGEHWSSIAWTHNENNKTICYNLESFVAAITREVS